MNNELSTPIPRKVKQGEFLDGGLRLETTLGETFRIPWERIRSHFAGKVEEKVSKQAPPKKGINVLRTTAALAAGPIGTAAYDLTVGKPKKEVQTQSAGHFFLLDLHVTDQSQPFRFDSNGTNFRTFLGEEAGYSGETNFFTFTRKLFSKLEQPEPSKNNLPVFKSRDEFSWASMKNSKGK